MGFSNSIYMCPTKEAAHTHTKNCPIQINLSTYKVTSTK